jgi:hypothetical protein
MTDDELLVAGCAGLLILGAVIALVFVILNLRAFSYSKRKEGGNTCLTVRAKRNLARVCVVARFGDEEITFERKRIRKGQSVDFVFPSSDKKAKLTVEAEVGAPHSVEV